MTVYGEIPIADYLRITGDVPKRFLPVEHVRKGYVFNLALGFACGFLVAFAIWGMR